MTIEWTIENEVQLFYAMMDHKPVGINKHFQMLAIHDKLTSLLSCSVEAKDIWEKLDTLYDLQALDDSDKLPFPNDEEDFALPQETFAALLESRAQQNNLPESTDDSNKSKSKHSLRKEDREEAVNGRKENKVEEEESREIPRRSLKRTRESLSNKNSSSPAISKRRR